LIQALVKKIYVEEEKEAAKNIQSVIFPVAKEP